MKQVSALSQAGQASEEHPPGRLIKVYRTQPTRWGKIYFWVMVLYPVFLVGGLAWLFMAQSSELSFLSPFWLVLRIGLPLLILIGGYINKFGSLRRHERLITPIRIPIYIYLHTEGFVYREGRQLRTIRWEQIEFVQRQVGKFRGRPRYSYQLGLRDGSEIALRGIIADVQELGSAIEREVVDLLWSSTLTKYQAGDPIFFKNLCITRRQLIDGAKKLPWDQVSEVKIDLDRLVIKKKGSAADWLAVPVTQIPNLCLLEKLLVYMKLNESLDLLLVV